MFARLIPLAVVVVTAVVVWRMTRRVEPATDEVAPTTSHIAGSDQERHWRLQTASGPVHVWIPPSFRAASADIVVYVHGFYSDVDEAWSEHDLRSQFAASGINAMFIACEAPSGPRDRVAWPVLGELLQAVGHHLDRELPQGDVIAVGHSAAYQTLATWLDDPRLHTIVRLDVPAGDSIAYRRWLAQSTVRRLVDVAGDMKPWIEPLHALPGALSVDLPAVDACAPSVAEAPVVYMESTAGHMEIVLDGEVIPAVLRCFAQQRQPVPVHDRARASL
ncbi:MAG: hypothetical protein AB7O24_12360 [Kofleriaceae bacterium]